MLRIISWNVNSFKCRLDYIHKIIKEYKPNILLLQETKIKVNLLDHFDGFHIYGGDSISGRNGVAILTDKISHVNEKNDRYIDINYDGLRIINVYAPSGFSVNSSKEHKINFFNYINNIIYNNATIIGGDWNICYRKGEFTTESNPFSQEEIDSFMKLLNNYTDTSLIHSNYLTWWDYRMLSFKKNIGMGIDKFLLSYSTVYSMKILRYYRGLVKSSDHAPIMIDL